MITFANYKNNINLIFVVLSLVGYFFLNNSFVSFKLVYILQILVIFFFYFQYKKIQINKGILVLNLIILICLFYKFDKSYVYLFLICILNTFFNFKDMDKIIIRKNLIFCSIFAFLSIFTFESAFYLIPGDVEHFTKIFLYEEIIKYSIDLGNCISLDLNFDTNNCIGKFQKYRYGIFGLQANLSAILCLLVAYIFLKSLKKKLFLIYFSLFATFFLYLTLSKSGLLFFLIIIFFSIFEINKKIIFLSFFLINLLIGFGSYFLVKQFSNVWKSNDSFEMSNVYTIEYCKKIKDIPIINYMNECKYEDKTTFRDRLNNNPIMLLFNIGGYSSFYKLYSYGMIVEHIIANYKDYLMPNPLSNMLKENKITTDQIKGDFAAHSLFFLSLIKYGILLSIIFFINLYLFFKKHDDNKLFLAFIFSSMFLSIDIFLLFPLYLLSIFVYSGYKKT